VTAWLVRALGAVLRLAPPSWTRGLGRALGWVWHDLLPIRRSTARRNVALALPGLPERTQRRVVRGAYAHFGRSVLELLRSAGQRAETGRFDGRAHLEAALAKGRGVVVITAHLGNFERLVALETLCGAPVHVVTRRFSSARAQASWGQLRRGGAALLAAGGSARATVTALKAGAIVGYVLDQHDAGKRAMWLPFFGCPAATSPDAARLARITGAALVPLFTFWDGQAHRMVAEPEIEPGANDAETTARCLARVEAAIAAHPEQWLWIHRRWKPRPGQPASA
jgi:KDO2-lipid IV(A) lauroyltransferase